MKKKVDKAKLVLRKQIKNLSQKYQIAEAQRVLSEENHKNYELQLRGEEQRHQETKREKDRWYEESNRQKAKIQRLEQTIRALKESQQKALLAFDVLN